MPDQVRNAMNAETLPSVDPMMVRRFIPIEGRTQRGWWGGVLVMDYYEVEDVGVVAERLSYDEAVVDCSRRIFQITTAMMMREQRPLAWTAFPSRRWRNFREGESIIGEPTSADPLLYLGNPVRLFANAEGIHVIRLPEWEIKSGIELGF